MLAGRRKRCQGYRTDRTPRRKHLPANDSFMTSGRGLETIVNESEQLTRLLNNVLEVPET